MQDLINPTTAHFWEAVGLIVLVAVLIWLKVPGMAMSALDQRAHRIQAQLDEATKLRQEAERLLADIRTQRETTERQGAEMLANAQAEARRLAADAAVRLEEQIKRRGQLAERRIALAQTQAAAEVKAAAAELAAEAAERVLAARLVAGKADPVLDAAVAQVAAKLQ